jgi:MFS family permease
MECVRGQPIVDRLRRPSTIRTDVTAALRTYLLANAAFLVPSGLFTVLFPWLVVGALHESPERVGIAQMVTQLPPVFLMLVAGFLADRFEQRRILVVTHLLVAVAQLATAALVYSGALSFATLLWLTLFGGIAGTFSGPPRDALLTRVAGAQIQRTVTLVIGLQFGAQVVGFVLASLTDRVGAASLLVLSATLFALGAIPSARLPSSEPTPNAGGRMLRDIGDGLRVALRSERIRPVLILTFALGLFFIGSFVVLLPLIIRDVYHGDAADLSLAFGANMTGTLVVIAFLMRRGGVQRQGRAFMLALLFGSAMLLLLYVRPPYWAFFVLNFVWGLGGGLTMTMGRSIVQESAPPELTARLVSIYAFAMSTGAPIGSLAIGYAAQIFGTLNAALLPGIGMAATVLLVHLTSRCWHIAPPVHPTDGASTTPELSAAGAATSAV